MKDDLKSSLVWLALAIYICVETLWKLPLGGWHDPGAGFWPMAAGLFLGGLSILNLLKSLLSKATEPEKVSAQKRWKALVLVVAALLAYAATMDYIGYLLGTFLLLVILFRAVEPQKWLVSIGGSALIALGTYAIFEVWLRSQLPRGIWGY